MFEPDRFSDANPKWLLINERSRIPSGLIELLEKEYSFFLGIIKGIYGSSALELNSKNLLVVGEKEKIVVKLCSDLTEDNFKRQVEIYNIITSKNLPSVKIVGTFFKPFDDKTSLIISYYYSGSYFSGNNEEFMQTFTALRALISSFTHEKFNLFCRHSLYPDDAIDVVAEFFQCLFRGKTNLGEEGSYLAKSRKKNIINADLFAREFSDSLNTIADSVGHADIHPHNIIVKNARITILDIDALKVSKWPLHLGFGIFKLLRQTYASKNTLIDRSNLEKIVSSLTAHDINEEDALGLTFNGAKWEVMRRLQIIMKGNLGGQVSAWNSVISIQIKALEEIEFLKRYYHISSDDP